MRSKAHFKSHPLHPILIVFPISFFTATLLFDLLYIMSDNRNFGQTAVYMNLAGIIAAVAAAIPGIIDYAYTVPPSSSAARRGARHGLLNSSVLLVFGFIYFLRGELSDGLLLLLETIAVIMMVAAGWMGGTLVHRNQIGVDIRYAYAGKWNEIYIEGDVIPADKLKLEDLRVNQMILLHFKGKRIVVGRDENSFVAFDDHCTHKGGSLAGGSMICSTVQCPWHGSQFDCRTGEVKAGPAKRDIVTYDVSIQEAHVVLTEKSIQ